MPAPSTTRSGPATGRRIEDLVQVGVGHTGHVAAQHMHLAVQQGDSDLARRYAQLKRELACRYPDDRMAYTEAKTEFVAEALRTWRGETPVSRVQRAAQWACRL